MFNTCTESLGLTIVPGDSPLSARSIQLQLGNVTTAAISTDAYLLTVDTDHELITVLGQTAAGVFYGVQTLVNLAFPDGELAALTVRDWPRHQYRGLHVDVARNFHSDVTQMKKLIDAMATYKLNKLHFHLSDDEAWRLEIPGLPELTEVYAASSLAYFKRTYDIYILQFSTQTTYNTCTLHA